MIYSEYFGYQTVRFVSPAKLRRFVRECQALYTLNKQVRKEATEICMLQTVFGIPGDMSFSQLEDFYSTAPLLLRPGIRHLQMESRTIEPEILARIVERCQLDLHPLINLSGMIPMYVFSDFNRPWPIISDFSRPWFRFGLKYAQRLEFRLNALLGRPAETACKAIIDNEKVFKITGMRKEDVEEMGLAVTDELLKYRINEVREIRLIYRWPPRQPAKTIIVSR